MKNIKYTKYDIIFILVITITSLILNFIYGYSTHGTLVSGLMLGLIDSITFTAYLFISRTPILANIAIILVNIITFVYDLISKATLQEAFEDTGIMLIMSVISIIIISIIDIKNIKVTFNRDDKLKNKISKWIIYDRKIHRLKWYYKIILYSLLITSVMAMSNSGFIDTKLSGTGWMVFASLTILFPVIRMMSLLSTTTLAYEIYSLYIIAEIFTLYMQAQTSNLNIVGVLFIVEEIVVLCYTVYRSNILNRKNN